MRSLLLAAAALIAVVGLAHSYLGERFILMRLFKRTDLPQLFGSADFTIRTLRFAWHLTTVAWFGFAALLYQLAEGSVSDHSVAMVVAVTALVSFVVAFIGSRGRHLAWLAFLAVGMVALYATIEGARP